ncbi:MAG: hypothetical protein D3917_02105 [Candidatus Electrothrix sp. AX5]|nr:hypothetical protein [Candidatus Electrothrix sp. AX5]
MEINSLKATDVFGYLDIDITFNKDITFIVGFNGSGKTTAIRLINAILTPSPKDLNLIPFDEAEVSLTHERKYITIMAKKYGEHISISVRDPNKMKGKFNIPILDFEEFEYRYEQKERGENYFKSLILEERDNVILKYILDLPSPYFLGLDRKIHGTDFFESKISRKRILSHSRRSQSHYQKIISGNLGTSLVEVQDLIYDTMSRIRQVADKENEKQRENLLISSFKYTKSNDVFSSNFDFTIEEDLLKRRDEFEETLRQLEMFKGNAEKEITFFFDSLQELLKKRNQGKNSGKGVDIEWIINKAQINRIYDFLKIIDDTKSKIDKINSNLRNFLDLVNSYYNETGKELMVDPLGRAILRRPKGGTVGLDALSSGEKQILIIFANSILRSGKEKVFIIDEPELSLHLNWQERFVEDIQSLKTGAQYIFATHSPEIIAGYEDKCKEVSK